MNPYQWAASLLRLPPESREAALAECPTEWHTLVLATVAAQIFPGAESYARKIASITSKEHRREALRHVPYELRTEVELHVREIFNRRKQA